MQSNSAVILKDLVLIGGGHSHVEILRSFGMQPIPGVRLSLITRDIETAYSGMLPGYLCGHYQLDETQVDLQPLCQFAASRLYHDQVIRVDPDSKKIICANHPPLSYDLLSINIGSCPDVSKVPGAAEFTTPLKPISQFVTRWHRLLKRVAERSEPHQIAVVGAGAAGVEVLLSIQFRLQQLCNSRQTSIPLKFHLICKHQRIMSGFPRAVAQRFERILHARGVRIHYAVEATEVHQNRLSLSDGQTVMFDEILWATAAGAPDWIRASGIDVDAAGFITANDFLQSTSHADIFAAGDIVHQLNHPRPKAGVFAVRQAKPLNRNLRRALLQQPLKKFIPQKSLLALISTGDQYAIASKSGWHGEGHRLWVWKDWIDRRWIAKYSRLPKMPKQSVADFAPGLLKQSTAQLFAMHRLRCGGCGAKVPPGLLNRALAGLKPISRKDIITGLQAPDDAAVIAVPTTQYMIQSVDYLRSCIDDPYLFGKIAANHSLNDIFAMGAEAQSALAIATLPYGIEIKVEETLSQLMSGALDVFNAAGVALVGGHTSEGAELALGFTINGLAPPEQILHKSGMRAGEVLILTKALGTGTLLAANMQGAAKGRWIKAAIDSMLQSNRLAATHLVQQGASACTDISGFGLLGHLVEMVRASGVNVTIDLQALPLIDGASATVKMGILSSLQPANRRLESAIRDAQTVSSEPLYPLLFDPQTSGGLLASLPAGTVDSCLLGLRDLGYLQARIIGHIVPHRSLQAVTLNP